MGVGVVAVPSLAMLLLVFVLVKDEVVDVEKVVG
jgi:hypothetical protein